MERGMDDKEFAEKILNEMQHVLHGLKYFIDKSERLENELEQYKDKE